MILLAIAYALFVLLVSALCRAAGRTQDIGGSPVAADGGNPSCLSVNECHEVATNK